MFNLNWQNWLAWAQFAFLWGSERMLFRQVCKTWLNSSMDCFVDSQPSLSALFNRQEGRELFLIPRPTGACERSPFKAPFETLQPTYPRPFYLGKRMGKFWQMFFCHFVLHPTALGLSSCCLINFWLLVLVSPLVLISNEQWTTMVC